MTIKLTDTQVALLTAACQRDDGGLLPPPTSLGTPAVRIRRVVAALTKRMLACECDTADPAKSWREEGGRHFGIAITAAGRAAIAGEQPQEHQDVPPTVGTAADVQAIEASPAKRSGTKQSLVLNLLRRDSGANIDDIVAVTGWLPHTTRAALTGLRKKGHTILRVGEPGASRYRIEANA